METVLLDRYQILESLKSGGWGNTFLAIDLQSQTLRKVVVKAFQTVDQQTSHEIIEKLFLKEATILQELGANSTQIPTLSDYFFHDQQYYLVEEYIEGKNLAQLGIIDSDQCFTLLCSLLNILQYLHSQNIIHRDIQPENIIIRASDGLPVLINLGAIKETMGSFMTTTVSSSKSVLISTRGFMPPEQNTGVTVFSSDLYALAWTMIYCLTGKFPMELPINHVTGDRDWQTIVPDLAQNLKTVLEKATSLDRQKRYSTAEAMYEDLNRTNTVVASSYSKAQVNLNPENHDNQERVFQSKISLDTPVRKTSNHQSNGKTVLMMILLLALGILGGLLIGQQINQTQIQLTQIEQEKAELEAKLAEEQRKTEEAEKERIKAEELQKRVERERARLEKLYRQEELEAQTKSPENNQDSPSQNNSPPNKYAFIGGILGIKNIRSGPGTNYSIISNGYTGDRIEILAQDMDEEGYLWYKIYHPESQTTGWIAGQLVEF